MGLYREFYWLVREHFRSLESKWEDISETDQIINGKDKYNELLKELIPVFFKKLKPDGVIEETIGRTTYSSPEGLIAYLTPKISLLALLEQPAYDAAFTEFQTSLRTALNKIIQDKKGDDNENENEEGEEEMVTNEVKESSEEEEEVVV
jgi:hypothetical protein